MAKHVLKDKASDRAFNMSLTTWLLCFAAGIALWVAFGYVVYYFIGSF